MLNTSIRPPSSVRSKIYQTLYSTQDFCSKQMLAARCGISMPTLYQNLNELMSEGLVQYSGEERSTGGRRAQGLEIIPDARLAVGIAVGGSRLRFVLTDLRLRELAYRAIPFDFVSSVHEENSSLKESLESFLDDFQVDRNKLLGVGITIPGLITQDHARIHAAPTLGLKDVPLELLTQGIPYPVFVENDASASGHAECFVRGGYSNLAYYSLEYGIGGAVVIGGIPYAGDNAQSGELGHICIEPGGLRCSCGKNGCMEPYCSPKRIEDTFGVSLEDFFRGVEQHNPDYEALLYDMLRHLAIAVNSVHMVLDCDVILGGLFSEYLQPYIPILKDYVKAGNPFTGNADFVQLSTLRHHITPLGASLHFVRAFVDSV
ncbi:MAG: ROK family transcriptional regulator [Oscillospiraceae bacterium]|nr:ROK family transcriptional regulator [Oscillospiraceae bacterium]